MDEDGEAKSAVEELLSEASRLGWGIAFEPDKDGWLLSYIVPHTIDWPGANEYSLDGGKLSEAYDVETAARAGLKTLREIAQSATRFRRK